MVYGPQALVQHLEPDQNRPRVAVDQLSEEPERAGSVRGPLFNMAGDQIMEDAGSGSGTRGLHQLGHGIHGVCPVDPLGVLMGRDIKVAELGGQSLRFLLTEYRLTHRSEEHTSELQS